MNLKKNISSLKLPHYKSTAGIHSVPIAPPKEVLIPTKMHSGGAAVPVVEVGEHVRVGQLIAREEGRNSSSIHASVSGTVIAIEPFGADQAIRIESDGKMEKDPAIAPPKAETLEEFLDALHGSGIVGLGGAAFPLYGKLDAARKNHIKTMLVNGAECEPFITSDHRNMLENTELIVKGVEILRKFLGCEQFVIGIEKNKPDAIAKLKETFANDPSVIIKPLKSVYPQGAKQVLLYNATGLVVGEGQRLASTGTLIINVTTLTKMAQYMETGMPLVDKCITVDGSAIKEPKNLIVPVGTPTSYIIEQAGGLKDEPGKVIFGGPMMGKTVKSIDEPVVKATNAVVVLNRKDSQALEPTPCIHCGRCAANCPLGLNPTVYAKAMEMDDEAERYAVLEKAKVSLCMSCGCCSYVCPACRPLVDTNSSAKRFVRAYKAAQEKKEGGR